MQDLAPEPPLGGADGVRRLSPALCTCWLASAGRASLFARVSPFTSSPVPSWAVGQVAGEMPGRGGTQGAHEVANSFLPKLGSPNFITVRSSAVRAPAGHPAHLHTCTCASGLMCALGVRGLGASFCSHSGLWVGMSAQGPRCGLDPGGNVAARRPGHLPSHPTVRSLISWLFSSAPT